MEWDDERVLTILVGVAGKVFRIVGVRAPGSCRAGEWCDIEFTVEIPASIIPFIHAAQLKSGVCYLDGPADSIEAMSTPGMAQPVSVAKGQCAVKTGVVVSVGGTYTEKYSLRFPAPGTYRVRVVVGH